MLDYYLTYCGLLPPSYHRGAIDFFVFDKPLERFEHFGHGSVPSLRLAFVEQWVAAAKARFYSMHQGPDLGEL